MIGAFTPGIDYTESIYKYAALAGMPRADYDAALANDKLKTFILQGQQEAETMYNVNSPPASLSTARSIPAQWNIQTSPPKSRKPPARKDDLICQPVRPPPHRRLQKLCGRHHGRILPGLTGVVGPNGCGKSNVIEALRWAMGEANARNMRGAEMEDVIFAGTAGRAARNLAEVTLSLEETAGLAPPPFHEQADLEISRKIERGGGSSYRVNGKEARARDVQTLFADLASGARASAMVSQGRVGALVNARPDERRALLEEAAGITGLHARRHEAELKLRAAEQNLSRAEDLKGQIEARLADLKRQARQASRYRNLSGAIRAAEAELLAIQRAVAQAARAAAIAAYALAEKRVEAAIIAAAEAAATPPPPKPPYLNCAASKQIRAPASSAPRIAQEQIRRGRNPRPRRAYRSPHPRRNFVARPPTRQPDWSLTRTQHKPGWMMNNPGC